MEEVALQRRRRSPTKGRLYRHRAMLFPQLLAAYRNIHRDDARSLLRRLLRSHLSFIRRSTAPSSRRRVPPLGCILPDGLLALLPPLLTLREDMALSILAADIVGAIALSSIGANEMVAMDEGIMYAVMEVLDKGIVRKKLVVAICNALLDLSTGSVGRRRLREFPILAKLLFRAPLSTYVMLASMVITTPMQLWEIDF